MIIIVINLLNLGDSFGVKKKQVIDQSLWSKSQDINESHNIFIYSFPSYGSNNHESTNYI